jgi:hypothetical protein
MELSDETLSCRNNYYEWQRLSEEESLAYEIMTVLSLVYGSVSNNNGFWIG